MFSFKGIIKFSLSNIWEILKKKLFKTICDKVRPYAKNNAQMFWVEIVSENGLFSNQLGQDNHI